jgi:cell division protein FtsI (penicillin-binding protein 3)
MRSARVLISPRRVGIARALLLIPFVVLAFRAAHLSVDTRGHERGEKQTQRVLTLSPGRGAVVDSSGAELALSVDSPSIYAVPSVIADIEAATAKIAPILGWSKKKLADRLRDRQSFLFLSRWVTPERAKRIDDLGIAGVGILAEPRRIYPHRKLAAPLIGFANIDGDGVRGIEQQENDWLRGTGRRIPVERDALGRLLWIGGEEKWNTAGGDIALTIDARLQAEAEEALSETVATSGARGGVVVVMDPWTGDILTLAENPGFDPNQFRNLNFASTRSPAFLDAVDPGSTLKSFLVAAALEAGAIETGDVLDCEDGAFKVPGKTIRDFKPHGRLSVADILRVSSNIGAVKIAYLLGPAAHYQALRRFGFGSTTNSQFPEESAGLLRPWKNWKPVDHATIAYGQGINVTPIQLASATSALANGGLWVQPRLVAARRAPGGSWHATRPEPVRRVIREEVAADVLAMLEGVVAPGGTGSRAALHGVRVGGKTGTSQKYDPETRAFATNRFDAWFIGIVPVDDPKLAIVVGIDEPQRPAHTGGATAAPLFARVAASQLTRYGIFTEPQRRGVKRAPEVRVAQSAPLPPVSAEPAKAVTRTQKKAPSRSKSMVVEELVGLGDRVLLPDFLGLTVAEVKQMTADGRLEVKISGQGHAVTQEPPPGTVFALSKGPVRIRFEARGAARGEGEG